jgi:heterodisulfide reductase subunit A-like polyferredoxin
LPPAERIKSFAEVDLGFAEETAVAEANRCMSCVVCSECLQCQIACEAEAVLLDQKPQSLTLEVGAIIAAPGFDLYDAAKKGEYGFGLYENVITSIQFERILSASGPTGGEVMRPSDSSHPKRIAFIQCVGSRDSLGDGYDHCSSVCCMYSTKEAIIAKEHDPEIQPTIFFIDVRAFGKGFEKYYEGAKKQYGVRYQRCMVSKVTELQKTKNLRLKYVAEDGTVCEEEFDLVVLAVGLGAPAGNRRLADALGISLDEHGFCATDATAPWATSRPGVFAAGPFREPKDIPETVVEGSAAAAAASRLLAPARGTLVVEKEYPPESDVSDEEPRIGAFICRCGRNIGAVVDVPAVVEYARTLPDVVFADENLYTCSQDALASLKEKIVENKLNRVVVASCTPLTHETLFRDTVREVGLNPYLFEMCSLREHCSWVHMNQPREATEKAKEIVRMTVAKARLLRPIEVTYFDLNHKCLVIGGGLAGMTAALSLAEQGFDSYIVEKEDTLGGNLRNLHFSLSAYDPQALLHETIQKVTSNPRIRVYTGARVAVLSGYLGNFTSTLRVAGEEDREIELEHGAVIVATGASEYTPRQEYLYGENPRVVTQDQFEEKLANSTEEIRELKSVVMIQCVGSRDEERPYCSRVCCGHAIKNALKLKELQPEAAVFVLYRDVRMYGFKERAYREAREKGVVFLRYEDEQKPTVSERNGRPLVEVTDAILGEKLLLETDYVVLSTGMVGEGNEELARVLKLPLTADGFFLEAHAKIRPLDFSADGMYVCGLAHSPKYVEETIAQANGAAVRAATLLSREKLVSRAEIVRVNEKICTGCGICVSVCPYEAREIDEETKKARILYVVCQGCGACAAACPNGATIQNVFEKQQVLEMVDSAVE